MFEILLHQNGSTQGSSRKKREMTRRRGKIMLIPKQTFKFFYNVIKFHEREQCC